MQRNDFTTLQNISERSEKKDSKEWLLSEQQINNNNNSNYYHYYYNKVHGLWLLTKMLYKKANGIESLLM